MSEQGSDKELLRRRYYPVVEKSLAKGVNTQEVIGRLLKAGFSQTEAEEMISLAMNKSGPGTASAPAPVQAPTPPALAASASSAQAATISAPAFQPQIQTGMLLPIIGGLTSAIVGGAVWGAVAILTDHELGILAWGLGVFCGIAVLVLGKGRRGFSVQIVAVTSSLLGILLGKYITFVYAAKHLTEASGVSAEDLESFKAIPYTSLKWPLIFVLGLKDMLNPYDALWVGLAVYFAWKVLRESSVTVAETSA